MNEKIRGALVRSGIPNENLMDKHIPYSYDTCKCKDCYSSRLIKQNEKLKEALMTKKWGSNWRNIFSGMGDQ